MKPLVIYHANCADGFSAAWCFHNKAKDFYDFHPGVYQNSPPTITDKDVYLVDFSYKRAVVSKMLELAKSVTILDHHKTAIEDLTGLDKIYDNFHPHFDISKSGASIAWNFLNPNTPAPLLINYIEDRDLWKFTLPNTRDISAAVFSYTYTFENWDMLMELEAAGLLELSLAGKAIERKHHKDVAELVKVCMRPMEIGGHVVPVASLPYTYSSDAGHLMAKHYKEGTVFAACYWDTVEGRTFSLRSCERGLDVSDIAKRYGGGGHKNAAGFTVDTDHVLSTY